MDVQKMNDDPTIRQVDVNPPNLSSSHKPKRSEPMRLMDGVGDQLADGVSENMTKSGRKIICEWKNTPLRQAPRAKRALKPGGPWARPWKKEKRRRRCPA